MATERSSRKDILSIKQVRLLFKNSRKLLVMVWKEHTGLVFAMAAVFLVLSFSSFLNAAALGFLINGLIESATTHALTQKIVYATMALIATNVLPSTLFTIQEYISRLFWMYLEVQFDMLVTKKKGELDIATHEDPKRKDLLNRVMENGLWRMQQFVDRQFYLFQNILEVVIASGVLLYQEWWTFFLILLGAIPGFFAELRYGSDVWGIWGSKSSTRRRYFDIRSHFDQIGPLTELKLFQNSKYFLKLLRDLYLSFQSERRSVDTKKFIFELISIIFSQVSLGVVVGFFVFQVVYGHTSVGTLTFLLASLGSFRASLSSLFGNIGRQYQDNLFITDVFDFLALPAVVAKPQNGMKLPRNKVPLIEFENVSFKYPGTDRFVMKNFSLKIEPKEKIALVGVNGAGKTTFVKLLSRFYDPTEGRILIDGHDLREVDLSTWYDILGAIFQDYDQYNFLVKEAIAVGNTKAPIDMSEIEAAAKNAEAHNFITEWKDSYDQQLGKVFVNGLQPSIGQWQKLALARAFYKDPRILILDEPTSSVDAEAEAKIFERLEESSVNRSVILISHRFSTVRHAHRIIIVDKGEIVEQGTHEELLAKDGTYARLFRLQAKGYQ